MNSFLAVGSALVARLGTVQYTYPTAGTTTTTGSVGIYNMLAPRQGTAQLSPPYLIFQHQAGVDEYTFHSHGESLDYVVKAVADRQTPLQAYHIYARAHDALQDAPLSIGTANVVRVRRQSRFEFRDGDGYTHIGGLYSIDLWDA